MAARRTKKDPLKTRNGKPRVVAMNTQQLFELYEKSNSNRLKDKARRMLLNIKRHLKKFGLQDTITI